jgi:hypothetical protein
MKLKIILKLLVIFFLFSQNAMSYQNRYIGSPSYWEGLKQLQKNFYMKGALDAWGYYIWNNAPDETRDLFISQYRFCIEKKSQDFQRNMFMLGWDDKDSAASELYRWSFASCNILAESDEYKKIIPEKNKPLENVNKENWLELSNTNKSTYVAGYIDGSLAIISMILADTETPKDMKDYYTNLSNDVYSCFEKKGLDKAIPFIIARELNDSYPIPWNVSFSFGAFCRE